MQQKFIESVEAAYKTHDGFGWFGSVLGVLPNCYAKGYIECKLGSLVTETKSREVVRISMLEWAKYDIWK